MRLLDPVLHEYGLQSAHDRTFDANRGIPPMLFVLALSQPLIGDAVAEHVADRAIDDQQFAMGSLIESAQIHPARTAVLRKLHAAIGQPLETSAICARSADRIDQQRTFTPCFTLPHSKLTNSFSRLPLVQTNVSRCTVC